MCKLQNFKQFNYGENLKHIYGIELTHKHLGFHYRNI